ncbi:MAG: PE-PPE domain-containing protein [Mycobacterium sp.]|uniref:PE-PPE domain-containing protein n=1 Tax=Mycobacterium sp. TaxID=1785 RepID=UPI003C75DD16
MKKAIVSALVAAPTLMAGAAYLTPMHNVQHVDYKLVDEALVIIPVNNPAYADAAANLYLHAAGFTVDPGYSNVATLDMPEVVSGGTLNDAVNQGVASLVSTVEADYNAGDMADGPLYVFGYSQSDVVMGMAEQQIAAYGIPQGDLHFVMVGDSASAEGGFLNAFIDELPTSWQPYIVDTFKAFGADVVLGQVTPDSYYPTDVYSLSGDGWTNYDYGLNDAGLFSDHLEYLGLTSQEIASAGAPLVDGLTNYFTIQDSMVNSLEALWTQLQIADSVLF